MLLIWDAYPRIAMRITGIAGPFRSVAIAQRSRMRGRITEQLAGKRARETWQVGPSVCPDLDLAPSVIRPWLAQADIDAGQREGPPTAEREEL